jgi:hypothetical protein
MKYEISIDVANDAFQDNQTTELIDILKQLARKLREYGKQESGDTIKLFDSNGNQVGQAKMLGK